MILYKDRYYPHKLIISKSIWLVSNINTKSLQILNWQRILKNSILRGVDENFGN